MSVFLLGLYLGQDLVVVDLNNALAQLEVKGLDHVKHLHLRCGLGIGPVLLDLNSL